MRLQAQRGRQPEARRRPRPTATLRVDYDTDASYQRLRSISHRGLICFSPGSSIDWARDASMGSTDQYRVVIVSTATCSASDHVEGGIASPIEVEGVRQCTSPTQPHRGACMTAQNDDDAPPRAEQKQSPLGWCDTHHGPMLASRTRRENRRRPRRDAAPG